MSLYVLDTDHVTLHQRDHPALCRRLDAADPRALAVTIVTVEEQLRGRLRLVRRAKSKQQQVASYWGLRIALEYFSSVQVLDFDLAAAQVFESLRQQKLRVGTRDLRIGAIVLTARGVLLTRNRRDFELIPGLTIEDWTSTA